MKKLIKNIQDNLSPDLLHKKYNKPNPNNPLQGHCYVASEALYYLLEPSDFKPKVATYEAVKGYASHWWLENKKTGKILDPTSGQFKRSFIKELYKKGRFCGFLTKGPCRKTQTLLNKINMKNNLDN